MSSPLATARTTLLGSVSALIAASAPAQAGIILSTLDNVPVGVSTSTTLDIDGDSTDDFSFFIDNGGGLFVTVEQVNHSVSIPYALNDPISYPAGTWDSSQVAAEDLVTAGGGFVGIRLYRSGTTSYHLGWMQFSFPTMDTDNPEGVLVSAAWESTADTAINAGDVGPVPEPGSFGVLSSLLAGFGIARWWRARRKPHGAERD